ncbi:hypothetical protein ACFSUD_15775 [Sulfitobacter aestuarii]|uniref:Uncharacterized protein n=1 Tax=Sulfitobacter aestuarii TaxID=2161676 RepID=A0ABW5U5G7_9RHOB
MMLLLVFLIVFGFGPLAFGSLTRRVPNPGLLRRMGLLALSAVLSGLVIRYGFAQEWARDPVLTLLVLALLWLGWIALLGFVAQILRHRDAGRRMRRWTGVIGALGTTMPWFGLATARMLGG